MMVLNFHWRSIASISEDFEAGGEDTRIKLGFDVPKIGEEH
jgi:hypothetical protein